MSMHIWPRSSYLPSKRRTTLTIPTLPSTKRWIPGLCQKSNSWNSNRFFCLKIVFLLCWLFPEGSRQAGRPSSIQSILKLSLAYLWSTDPVFLCTQPIQSQHFDTSAQLNWYVSTYCNAYSDCMHVFPKKKRKKNERARSCVYVPSDTAEAKDPLSVRTYIKFC